MPGSGSLTLLQIVVFTLRCKCGILAVRLSLGSWFQADDTTIAYRLQQISFHGTAHLTCESFPAMLPSRSLYKAHHCEKYMAKIEGKSSTFIPIRAGFIIFVVILFQKSGEKNRYQQFSEEFHRNVNLFFKKIFS